MTECHHDCCSNAVHGQLVLDQGESHESRSCRDLGHPTLGKGGDVHDGGWSNCWENGRECVCGSRWMWDSEEGAIEEDKTRVSVVSRLQLCRFDYYLTYTDVRSNAANERRNVMGHGHPESETSIDERGLCAFRDPPFEQLFDCFGDRHSEPTSRRFQVRSWLSRSALHGKLHAIVAKEPCYGVSLRA